MPGRAQPYIGLAVGLAACSMVFPLQDGNRLPDASGDGDGDADADGDADTDGDGDPPVPCKAHCLLAECDDEQCVPNCECYEHGIRATFFDCLEVERGSCSPADIAYCAGDVVDEPGANADLLRDYCDVVCPDDPGCARLLLLSEESAGIADLVCGDEMECQDFSDCVTSTMSCL